MENIVGIAQEILEDEKKKIETAKPIKLGEFDAVRYSTDGDLIEKFNKLVAVENDIEKLKKVLLMSDLYIHCEILIPAYRRLIELTKPNPGILNVFSGYLFHFGYDDEGWNLLLEAHMIDPKNIYLLIQLYDYSKSEAEKEKYLKEINNLGTKLSKKVYNLIKENNSVSTEVLELFKGSDKSFKDTLDKLKPK